MPRAPCPFRRADHHRHREGRGDRPGRRASSSVRTTTSSSRSDSASSSRGSVPSCGALVRRPRSSRLVAGGLEIDLRSRRVTLRGEELALTPKEFDLLALLASDPGAVVEPRAPAARGVEDGLVRLDEDDRRPRRLGAQEARRPPLDRDGARRRAPARAAAVKRRLLVGYLGRGGARPRPARGPARDLVSRERSDRLSPTRSSGMRSLSRASSRTRSSGALRCPARVRRIARDYGADTGARVLVVDRQRSCGSSTPRRRAVATSPHGRRSCARSTGEIATGTRASQTLGTDLLYVAVPVASSGVVHGAVRISYPTVGRRCADPSLLDDPRDHRGRRPRRRGDGRRRSRSLGDAPSRSSRARPPTRSAAATSPPAPRRRARPRSGARGDVQRDGGGARRASPLAGRVRRRCVASAAHAARCTPAPAREPRARRRGSGKGRACTARSARSSGCRRSWTGC